MHEDIVSIHVQPHMYTSHQPHMSPVAHVHTSHLLHMHACAHMSPVTCMHVHMPPVTHVHVTSQHRTTIISSESIIEMTRYALTWQHQLHTDSTELGLQKRIRARG